MWYEPVFYACNYGVLLPWTLLVVAPRWRWTDRLVSSALPPALLGVAYAIVLFTDDAGSPDGGYLTLDGVVAIFTSRQTVAAAWIHYLVFDLFVGAWEVRDARRLAIPHPAVVPCLLGTLLFGPVGLLAYLGLRAALRRRLSLVAPEPAQRQA
ncbi:MAG TPA: ABA4-like family protein [Sandaracinaceae bacterium LLY-WYZ-13_1]|nr:ABA4-like family protein [Sandaracinaceae bacterium LLY-WYZ-13_1]